jgi:hypothetical protein
MTLIIELAAYAAAYLILADIGWIVLTQAMWAICSPTYERQPILRTGIIVRGIQTTPAALKAYVGTRAFLNGRRR